MARIAEPGVHVVTLTITEAGYGSPVIDLLVQARGAGGGRRGGPPHRALSCDNLPRNGEVLAGLSASAARTTGSSAT